MKSNTLTLVACAVAMLALSGCGSTPTNVAQSTYVPPKTVISDMPSWITKPPESTSENIYVTGTATSRDMSMSHHKAQLDAEIQLANKLAGKVSTLSKDYKRDVGDEYTASTEIVTSKLAADVMVIGGVVEKRETVAEGAAYRTYVLLRMPIGTNNRLLSQYLSNKTFHGSKEAAERELDQKTNAERARN